MFQHSRWTEILSRGKQKGVFEAYTDSEGPEKPVHPRSLITTFSVRV